MFSHQLWLLTTNPSFFQPSVLLAAAHLEWGHLLRLVVHVLDWLIQRQQFRLQCVDLIHTGERIEMVAIVWQPAT